MAELLADSMCSAQLSSSTPPHMELGEGGRSVARGRRSLLSIMYSVGWAGFSGLATGEKRGSWLRCRKSWGGGIGRPSGASLMLPRPQVIRGFDQHTSYFIDTYILLKAPLLGTYELPL